MGCLDSSTTRVAASRYQTGVVQLKNVKKWVSARADMNWNLFMAILSTETIIREVAMRDSIYWLLMFEQNKSNVLEHWSKMTYKERLIAMEIAL